MSNLLNCVMVGIGGFLGSVCRYLIGLIPINPENGFPVKTLLINVTGTFLLGLITALAAKHESFHPQIILMLRIGLCGGFTTFSTFAFESVDLMKNGSFLPALCYMFGSILLGTAAIYISQMLVK